MERSLMVAEDASEAAELVAAVRKAPVQVEQKKGEARFGVRRVLREEKGSSSWWWKGLVAARRRRWFER